jgi:hypothetical protein
MAATTAAASQGGIFGKEEREKVKAIIEQKTAARRAKRNKVPMHGDEVHTDAGGGANPVTPAEEAVPVEETALAYTPFKLKGFPEHKGVVKQTKD